MMVMMMMTRGGWVEDDGNVDDDLDEENDDGKGQVFPLSGHYDDGDDEEECAVEGFQGVSAAWLSDAWGPR